MGRKVTKTFIIRRLRGDNPMTDVECPVYNNEDELIVDLDQSFDTVESAEAALQKYADHCDIFSPSLFTIIPRYDVS